MKLNIQQYEERCQAHAKQAQAICKALVGREMLITGYYNGQPYGDSKPNLKGKILFIESAHVDQHGQICVRPAGHSLYMGTDKFELVGEQAIFEPDEPDSTSLLKRAAAFVQFVRKCVRQNGEYAPLHRQELDELDRDLGLKVGTQCGHAACQSLGVPHPFCEFAKSLEG